VTAKTLAMVLALVACSDRERAETRQEPERPHRVIEPPSGRVRPLPPHAIRADGVGPYRLGAALADLVYQLASGPRIETIDIPNVVHLSVLRAEDNAILIGGPPLGKASFVAVVGSEIARTESGVHVGSTREEVEKALGATVVDPERARDPRLLVPSGLRNARVVLDGDRVAALVVTTDDGARAPTPGEPAVADDLLARAEADKLLARVPGLVFTAPLRDPDGHDELIAISRTDDAQQRTWTLRAFRAEGSHFATVIEPTTVYQLTAANARWIGADLRDLDLYLELHSRADAIEVGGLLTARIGDKLLDVVVISPAPVPRRRPKSAAPEGADAGTSGASTEGADHRVAP
jgi:hypothetical protein